MIWAIRKRASAASASFVPLPASLSSPISSLDRGDRPFTKADWDLAEHVVSCWTNFAKTGDPGLGWKQYTAAAPDFMVFDLTADGTADASTMRAPLKRQ